VGHNLACQQGLPSPGGVSANPPPQRQTARLVAGREGAARTKKPRRSGAKVLARVCPSRVKAHPPILYHIGCTALHWLHSAREDSHEVACSDLFSTGLDSYHASAALDRVWNSGCWLLKCPSASRICGGLRLCSGSAGGPRPCARSVVARWPIRPCSILRYDEFLGGWLDTIRASDPAGKEERRVNVTPAATAPAAAPTPHDPPQLIAAP
jgi:hypothetical protein